MWPTRQGEPFRARQQPLWTTQVTQAQSSGTKPHQLVWGMLPTCGQGNTEAHASLTGTSRGP